MCHVLIIEDEMIIAGSIERALEDAGATSFDIVDTEHDAIIAARAHRPDLITSDVALRSGTGPRAVRSIHAELGEMPVIFITGTPEDCSPCDPPGTILPKPFSPARLVAAYHQAFAQRAANLLMCKGNMTEPGCLAGVLVFSRRNVGLA